MKCCGLKKHTEPESPAEKMIGIRHLRCLMPLKTPSQKIIRRSDLEYFAWYLRHCFKRVSERRVWPQPYCSNTFMVEVGIQGAARQNSP